MKLPVVIFITLSLIGIFFYYRQKPETFTEIKQIITDDSKVVQDDPLKDLLLPDMVIIPPKELFITKPSSNKKVIRFSTTFANHGDGPLEIIGHSDEKKKLTYATQYVKKIDGPGYFQEVGTFGYHPSHNHWHVENYVRYQIWHINSKDQTPLATTGKQSFCIFDESKSNVNLPDSPKSAIYSNACGRNTQGMSVGWSDTYKARIDGQEIDITSIPDGDYLLTFEVNPDKKVLEKDYKNNLGSLKINISGTKLTIIN